MSRGVRASALLGVAVAALAAPARGETSRRIETRVAPACRDAARELELRVARAFDGSLANGLEATVSIDAATTGYRVSIATRDGAKALGTTVIAVPSCDEAVDAAVVVLALALRGGAAETPEAPLVASSDVEPAIVAPVPPAPTPAPAPPLETRTPDARRLDRGEPEARARTAPGPTTRLSLATGADIGTLPDPTMTLSGAFAQSFPAVELGAVVRFGLPVLDETVETGFSESVRRDFAALELRACRGTGVTVRVSACAGGELGLVRVARRLEAEDGVELDEDAVTPRLAGTLAARFSRPGGFIEPEIELAGAAVALGRDEGSSWLAVRVAAGAAVAF